MSSAAPTVVVPMSKAMFCLLKLFQENDLNDAAVSVVMDTVANFPVAEARAWVDALCAELRSLPQLGGSVQVQKSTYVINTVQQKLSDIAARVAVGLPMV